MNLAGFKKNNPEPAPRPPTGARAGSPSHCRLDPPGGAVSRLLQRLLRQVAVPHRYGGGGVAKGLLNLVEGVSGINQHRGVGVPEVVEPEPLQIGRLANPGPIAVQVAVGTPLPDEQRAGFPAGVLQLVQNGQGDVVEGYGPPALRFRALGPNHPDTGIVVDILPGRRPGLSRPRSRRQEPQDDTCHWTILIV